MKSNQMFQNVKTVRSKPLKKSITIFTSSEVAACGMKKSQCCIFCSDKIEDGWKPLICIHISQSMVFFFQG